MKKCPQVFLEKCKNRYGVRIPPCLGGSGSRIDKSRCPFEVEELKRNSCSDFNSPSMETFWANLFGLHIGDYFKFEHHRTIWKVLKIRLLKRNDGYVEKAYLLERKGKGLPTLDILYEWESRFKEIVKLEKRDD